MLGTSISGRSSSLQKDLVSCQPGARSTVDAHRPSLEHEHLVLRVLAEPASEDESRRAAPDNDVGELARRKFALDALARDAVAEGEDAVHVERDEARGGEVRLDEGETGCLVRQGDDALGRVSG